MSVLSVVLIVSFLTLLFAFYWATVVFRADQGSVEMGKIAHAIREGANAFLYRQYSTIGIMGIITALLLFLLYNFSPHAEPEMRYKVFFSFLIGAGLSALSGLIGMYTSVRANLRVAAGLSKGMSRGFDLALKGGAVSGLTVVAMSLLGVGGVFFLFGGLKHPTEVPLQIVGFGFGASFVALFAQLGGGIYTKAADVGADLIGKVEKGIPEDDPRNPAVIADLVGDNVGDCAGRGADLFESMSAENIGAMILGSALYPLFGLGGILFPLVVRAFGLISTIIGLSTVRASEDEHPSRPLARGFLFTSLLSALGFYLAVSWLLQKNLWFFACGLVGLATAVAILFTTYYYTEYQYSPVLSIATASRTGSATNIITGLGVALECTALPTVILAGALMLAYHFGTLALPDISGTSAGLYGTAIATMGMLAPCAYILAMDTFGPIVDNAGGIVEMSGGGEQLRINCEKLDATGNTTKALTKGYAIGSAALSAFLLFRAYLDEVEKVGAKYLNEPITPLQIDLGRIPNFVGAFFGAGLVLLFSALAIKAVGTAAVFIISEVRRQFQE
ncbi:MAG: sodium-translocating pyrophosphatase, partial [bacterium]